MKCTECKENTNICNYYNDTIEGIQCKENKYLDKETNQCLEDDNCLEYNNSNCI